jgi:hypothetical protein
VRSLHFEGPLQQQVQSQDSLTTVRASVSWICHPEDSWQTWNPSAGLANIVVRPPGLCKYTYCHMLEVGSP